MYVCMYVYMYEEKEKGVPVPVPPSWPDIWMMSAPALVTPEATVPMPTSLTSFTDTGAAGLIWWRSSNGLEEREREREKEIREIRERDKREEVEFQNQ